LIWINAALRKSQQAGRTSPARGDLGMSAIERRTIGIVDDDQAVRDSFRFLLEVVGHPVETFASAAEFLSAERHDLACLVLDQHLPQMTGLQLAEKLLGDGSGIRILLITGSPSPAIFARAARLDIRVMEKPPDEHDVVQTLRRLWSSHSQNVVIALPLEADRVRMTTVWGVC
jgi:two-component system, LuxR family, response regulator FixJ